MPEDRIKLKRLMEWVKGKISPRAFTHAALILSAAWFLGVYPLLNLFHPSWLPERVRPYYCDFGQYYAGAMAAKQGIWECLYPTVNTAVYDAAPKFQPRFKTFLFDERNAKGNALFYPPITNCGIFHPKLLKYCPELQTESYDSFRFMYPPPLALLLQPLAYFDFKTSAYHVWPILLMSALFGLAYFSSRIHRLFRGGVSYTEGLILVAFLFASFLGHMGIAENNATPILGFLIVFSVYAWMKDWQCGVGIAMIPLVLFKAIGLNWCPLLLLRRIQWKTILTSAFLTVLLNGLVIYLAGSGVYRTYFSDMLPKLVMPVGCGVQALIFNTFGFCPTKTYLALNLAVCFLLYYGYWKRWQTNDSVDRRAVIAATLAGTIAVFCLFNFSVQGHYFAPYLFFPFLGWVMWEAFQVRGRWHVGIIAGVAIGYIMTCDLLIRGAILYGLGRSCLLIYHEFTALIYAFFFPLFFLTVAFRRLYFAPPHSEHEAGKLNEVITTPPPAAF